MKNILFLFMAVTMIMLPAKNASALSIEQRSDTNGDGTPKFADPDEQASPFLIMPEKESDSSTSDSSGRFVNRSSVPDMLGITRQSIQDFDRTFSHLQNQ